MQISNSGAKRLIVIFTVLLLSRLGKTQFVGPPNNDEAEVYFHDQHPDEIDCVHTELNPEFNNFDDQQQNVAATSIILQPLWTQLVGLLPVMRERVQTTPRLLQEAKTIRTQINKAVTDNAYVNSPHKNRQNQQDVMKEITTLQNGRTTMDTLLRNENPCTCAIAVHFNDEKENTALPKHAQEEFNAKESLNLNPNSNTNLDLDLKPNINTNANINANENEDSNPSANPNVSASPNTNETLHIKPDSSTKEDPFTKAKSNPSDGPNIVDAINFDGDEIDIRKLQRLEVSKRRTKETLVLKSVEEDFSFDLGDDVKQWAHILHNGTEYFIGRRDTDLLIIHKDSATYKPGVVVEVGQPISYLLTYSYWNVKLAQQEGVILVASRDQVLWYRASNVTGQLSLDWTWTVGQSISGLTHFKLEGNNYIIISSDESALAGYFTMNIYQYELSLREFWIAQRIQLEYACSETTVLDTGRDVILAVPQLNTTAIYAFNPRADANDHIRFQLRRHIDSEAVDSVAAFRMGGRSYLALSGLQPQILVYDQGELVPRTILTHTFGLVQLFLPVPVRTYRDDMILFVQHRVDFATHSITVLETLIWDGEAFEASIPVPCHMGVHTVYGVSCMLDLQRDEGLMGAALFRRGDEVSIIVPRDNAESGLFRLHTELLARNSELVDLQEIFTFLQDWVHEQDQLVAYAQNFLNASNSDTAEIQVTPDLSEIQMLETPELKFDGEFGDMYINDYQWTDEDDNVKLEHLFNVIKALETDLKAVGRRRRDINAQEEQLIFEQLALERVDVEELLVQRVNEEDFFVQQGALKFDGIVNVQNLTVMKKLNAGQSRRAREAEQFEPVVIADNIIFETINGISWEEISQNLVFRNQPLNLTDLVVKGDIIVEDSFTLQQLNSLAFPDDFLWSSGPSISVVKASKTFTNTLSANAMDIEGLINGADPLKAITLSDAQAWKGLPTFSQLRISEVLQLNGTTRGRNLVELPNNPTLKDAHDIEANCNFRQLFVQGPVRVEELYAGQPLTPLLLNVVQRPVDPEAEINISSHKTFSSVSMPIDFNVLDGNVNKIPIEQFVPAHTDQQLNLTKLHANVYFVQLVLNGNYDGVDISKLMIEAIKLDEPQLAHTTQLNLAQPFIVQSFNVSSSLNGVPIGAGYQTLEEDINTPATYFEHLAATEADIPNDIMGVNVQLNGWNMSQYTQEQQQHSSFATGNIYVDELTLLQGLQADRIHGINATLVWQFLLDMDDDLTEMILDGKIQVDNIVITGDVLVHKLNQQHFDEDLQLTIVWLNRPNYLSTSLQFMDPLYICGNLQVTGNYNNQHLPTLIGDMIFRGANATTQILATKSFAGDVRVFGDMRVDAINGVPFQHIATKKTLCNFRGSLVIDGVLDVHELELGGLFNEQSMSALSSSLRFDRQARAFIIQGSVSLPTPKNAPQHYLQDLSVLGNLNNLPNLRNFFNDLVYKGKMCVLKGRKTFTGRVSIEKGAYIRELNSYNLLALLGNIVYVNEPETVMVRSPIHFAGPVKVEQANIEGTLDTSNISGCALKQWTTDTLRIDQPQEITNRVIFAPDSINGNAFYVSYLNEIDLSQLITLNTPQNLTNNMVFAAIYLDGQIETQKPVNNIDLRQEYENTLLTHGNQHVTTPLTLRSALVQQDLQTHAPINNNKDLQNLATLQGDLHFESPLYFVNLSARNVQTQLPITGINMDQWFHTALWTHDKPQQLITGNWSARSLTVKSGPILSTYVDIRTGTTNSDIVRRDAPTELSVRELCSLLTRRLEQQRKRAYLPKYYEESFVLKSASFDNNKTVIRAVFVLQMQQNDNAYLLVNRGCHTHVLKWQVRAEAFEKIAVFESGYLKQVLLISENERSENASGVLQYVALSEKPINANSTAACAVSGLNMWQLQQRHIMLLKSFEENIVEVQLAAENNEKLYALSDNSMVYGYNLTEHKRTNNWQLPNWLGKGSYRFVPQPQLDALVLTNGVYIVAFNDDTLDVRARNKRNSTIRYSLPLYYQRALLPLQDEYLSSESVLQSRNAQNNETRSYEFADFRALIWRILDDLDYRLRLEVNITQLSIPETDLLDEHLVQDFLDIMEELKRQNIYPNETFTDIDLRALRVPKNPAQVLAARTVQIVWPVIIEMKEIQGYLSKPDEPTHPICADITAQLGVLIHDVLILANGDASSHEPTGETAIHEWDLAAVIERILLFQHYLRRTMSQLHARAFTEDEIDEIWETSESNLLAEKTNPPVAVESGSLDTINFANNTGDWLKITNRQLPAHGAGEMLTLEVGASTAPLSLLAVTYKQSPRLGIRLYMDVLSGNGLFQSIVARKPRALSTLRYGAQTLLAYVEGCCDVRVLIYRGVEGFVEFARFESRYGAVLQLFSVFLSTAQLEGHNYLGVVYTDRMVFYRLIASGKQLIVPLECYESLV